MSENPSDYQTLTQEYATTLEIEEASRFGLTQEGIQMMLEERQHQYASNPIGRAAIFASLLQKNHERTRKLLKEYVEIMIKMEKCMEIYTGLSVLSGTICLKLNAVMELKKFHPDACVFSTSVPAEKDFIQIYFLTSLKNNTQGGSYES